MANVRREDRVQNTDVKRLNNVGLGIKAIAGILGCHPATITLRLDEMGVPPTDTRRSFMEQVWNSLTIDEQEWLSHNLFNAGIGIKEFVIMLLKREYQANPATVTAVPAPMPELEGGLNAITVLKPSDIPTPDMLEQPLGGVVYGPEDGKPTPEQQVPPEKLAEGDESPPAVKPGKKLNFG